MAEPNGHPDLAARALDRLHPSERAAFDRHLEECGNCRAELSALHETVALLALAAPASQPSAALAGRTFAAIEREATGAAAPRRRRRSWRWPVLAVGAGTGVTVAATALVLALGLGSTPGEPGLRAVLAAPSGPARASVDVRGTGIGRVITFRSDTLPILPKGDYYELWFVGPGDRPGHRNRISAGTFHPDQQGRSHVRFTAAVDPTKFPVLSVTAEPGDGDPRPTGPEVLRSTK